MNNEMPISISDMLPRANAPQATQDQIIAELHRTCADSQPNIYLRGSLVRGDAPYGDVDLLIAAEEYSLPDALPDKVLSVPVSATVMSPQQLEKYCRLTPRAWYLLTEHIKVGGNDEHTDAFLDRFKDYFLADLLGDYALYLAVEQRAYSRREDILNDGNYYAMKRLPGSKRSLMRGIFIAKTICPDLYEVTSSKVIMDELAKRGLAHTSLPDDARMVSHALATESYQSNAWQKATSNILAWVDNLIECSQDRVVRSLPKSYVELISRAEGENPEEALAKIEELPSYRRWTGLLAYTANPAADPEQLMHIWQQVKGQYGYKVIERFLLRNRRFPIERINPNDIKDFHSRFTLGRRAVLSVM